MSEPKVINSFDEAGNEIITVEVGEEKEAITLTLGDMYEERTVVDFDAKNILTKEEVSTLNNPPPEPVKKASRLEVQKATLRQKSSGKIFPITMGSIPTLEARTARDITGAFLQITDADTKEVINVLVPFKKDGTIPESFPYEVENENTES